MSRHQHSNRTTLPAELAFYYHPCPTTFSWNAFDKICPSRETYVFIFSDVHTYSKRYFRGWCVMADRRSCVAHRAKMLVLGLDGIFFCR